MKPASNPRLFKSTWLFALVALALLVLRQDFWLRDNANLIAGLPAGLLYHVGYCGLVSVVLGLFLSRSTRGSWR